MQDLTSSLGTHFGFPSFRPGQAEAIAHLLAGRHTLVVMPTGAGKSLVYQLAALNLPGVALVLSPLIALMQDQVDGLARRRVPATCIHSALPAHEQAHRLRGLAQGAYRLAYVSPERLRSAPFQEALRNVTVSLLAVDEAHCISQWGHDFRPDYLHIAAARSGLGSPVTAALTATATPRVQDDIVRLLGLDSAQRVVTGFNRPNLAFGVRYGLGAPAKLQALRDLLVDLDGGAAIVYVGTRHDAEEVAEFVRAVAGGAAQPYHAGLTGGARARIQEAFLAGGLPVVVATNAFGLGIDRPDVRLVAHYALPGTLEAYYQEAGRAGRDGAPAQAVLLYAPRDRALQEWFIENDAPAPAEVRALHAALQAASRPICWRTIEELSLATGLPEIKLKVGLAQLEAAGSLERLGDEGPRMLLRLGRWNEPAVQAAAARVEERRRQKREQLAGMVAYAEADGCRRRLLLDHFGDPSPAVAHLCCDNCLAGSRRGVAGMAGEVAELPPAQRAALVILDAVCRLKWGVGRGKLAQMLRGSRARGIQQFGYDRQPYYGRLAVFSQREIEDLVGQLIASGHLKLVGAEQPVLQLSPLGQAALKAREAVPLRLPREVQREAVQRKAAVREAGGTVALTAQLLGQGLPPAEIARQRGLTVGTIYAHLAQLIGEGRVELAAVVPGEVAGQVRAAIARVADVAQLAPLKALLPEAITYGEIRCVVEDWRRAHRGEATTAERAEDAAHGGAGPSHPLSACSAPSALEPGPDSEIAAFLARPHPRPLVGPWQVGWALGFHSGFAGGDWSRSPVGGLAYRLKYEGDASALPPLLEQALALCTAQPELAAVEALVPVPPSTARPLDPVGAWAAALGARLGLPVWAVVAKARRTAPQKALHTLAQKRANVAGAFAVRGDVRGKALLVLDDLYDSGATLQEVTRVLRQAGAARVNVLTLTRTIHSDV